MRFVDPSTPEKLGFDEILAEVSKYAATIPGRAGIEMLSPLIETKEIGRLLDATSEWMELLEKGDDYTFLEVSDVNDLIRGIEVEGNWLEAEQFHKLRKWIQMAGGLRSFFKSRKADAPVNHAAVAAAPWNKDARGLIDGLLDKEGNVRDDASERLRDIRKQIKNVSSGLRSRLSSLMKQAVSKGWSAEPEFTLRNGRYVIPLKADFKGRVPGFVQDISQSGQTVFVEPTESLELNNELRSLHSAEENEIRKLLIELTAELAPYAPDLQSLQLAIVDIDVARAKAVFADRIGAQRPAIDTSGETHELIRAWHPLLKLSGGKKKEEIVSMTMRLKNSSRIVVISGPNAGGKTITLKTVGLLQIMLQTGIPVTADSQSRFRIFDSLFLDIGDEQSIQSDLSTYTSHLHHLSQMLGGLGSGSLFLIDEFGTGTDPRQGGAIAEAFLERFIDSGAYGIITTHYGNLKTLAEQVEGAVNAAMQFDPETLSPSFEIRIGMPGRSYAFEIARKVGVPEELLEAASSKMDGSEIRSEELLLQLESQQSELEEVLSDNKEKRDELKKLLERNRSLVEEKERKKKEAIEQAEKEARGLIKEANKKIERTIAEIRKSQAEREETKRLREELKEMLPKEEPKEEKPKINRIEGEKPVEGDWVQIGESENVGELVEVKGNRGVVVSGNLRLTVKVKELVKVEPPEYVNQKTSSKPLNYSKSVSPELNVMGLRVEAALPKVTTFIDDAILANLSQVRILHGKGTGALRIAIRDLLEKREEVLGVADEHIEAGGAGWTVVRLA